MLERSLYNSFALSNHPTGIHPVAKADSAAMLLSTMGIRPRMLSCPKVTSLYPLSHTRSWSMCLHWKPEHRLSLESTHDPTSSLQENPCNFVLPQKLCISAHFGSPGVILWNMLHVLSLLNYQLINSFLATSTTKHCFPSCSGKIQALSFSNIFFKAELEVCVAL